MSDKVISIYRAYNINPEPLTLRATLPPGYSVDAELLKVLESRGVATVRTFRDSGIVVHDPEIAKVVVESLPPIVRDNEEFT